ncbi:MAG: DegV family protein [Chloroflexi bacterium]|nr:DegV family protein [Chloroflexota bacterium]
MPKIAIVSDSTLDMPPEWPKWPRLHIIPVHIRFGNTFYREGVDIDETTFYRRVEEEGSLPKTSQPNPSEFAELYRRLAPDYDAIISMHVTAKLSGTYQSAMTAAEMVKEEVEVHPFDTKAGSAASGFMADEAIDMIDGGASLEAVMQRLREIRDGIHLFLTPETLKYAVMSGRISALGSAVASLLKIKPLIVLQDGELIAGERVRTRTRAVRRLVEMMVDRVGNHPIRLAVVHAQAPAAAQTLAALAQEHLNCGEPLITTLATSVAVHLGPGTVGLVAYETR